MHWHTWKDRTNFIFEVIYKVDIAIIFITLRVWCLAAKKRERKSYDGVEDLKVSFEKNTSSFFRLGIVLDYFLIPFRLYLSLSKMSSKTTYKSFKSWVSNLCYISITVICAPKTKKNWSKVNVSTVVIHFANHSVMEPLRWKLNDKVNSSRTTDLWMQFSVLLRRKFLNRVELKYII